MQELARSKKILIAVREVGERPPAVGVIKVSSVGLSVDKRTVNVGEPVYFRITVFLEEAAPVPCEVNVKLVVNGESVASDVVSFSSGDVSSSVDIEYVFREPGTYSVYAVADDYAKPRYMAWGFLRV